MKYKISDDKPALAETCAMQVNRPTVLCQAALASIPIFYACRLKRLLVNL